MRTIHMQATRHHNTRRPSQAAAGTRQRVVRTIASWKSLSVFEEPANPNSRGSVTKISTAHFALGLFLGAGVFTLYIAHVYASQDLLNSLQQMRRENLQLHLKHNRITGAIDRATGPSVIYRRAAALGLEEGIIYGPPILLDETGEPIASSQSATYIPPWE